MAADIIQPLKSVTFDSLLYFHPPKQHSALHPWHHFFLFVSYYPLNISFCTAWSMCLAFDGLLVNFFPNVASNIPMTWNFVKTNPNPDPLSSRIVEAFHHSPSVLHNQSPMAHGKQFCYFWAICLYLSELIPFLHRKSVSHVFMMTLQRCWSFSPVNPGSKWKPHPRFKKCRQTKQNAVCLCTLYSSHADWSNQLLLKPLDWFPNGCMEYFFWRTGHLGPSWRWSRISSTVMLASSAAIAGRFPSSAPSSGFPGPGQCLLALCPHLHETF